MLITLGRTCKARNSHTHTYYASGAKMMPARRDSLAIIVLLGASAITSGVRVREEGATSLLSTDGCRTSSGLSQVWAPAPRWSDWRGRKPLFPSHLVDCDRSWLPSSLSSSSSSSSSSSFSSPRSSSPPPRTLLRALLSRGGAKLAPSQSQPPAAAGGGGTSRRPSAPVLGPITRRNAADSTAGGKDDEIGMEEGQQEFAPQFLDFQSRVGFMKKVYLTLSIQLVYTGLVCSLMRGYREPILRLIFAHGGIPPLIFMIGTLGTIILTQATMIANIELRQNFPRNLPLLTVFTTAWALYVGVFSLMFTRGSVMRAVFQAAFIVGSLTAYAFRTNPKHELTQLGAGLYSAANAFGMFCLMKLFFFRGHRASDLAVSCFATLLFSLFLVYDTYRIIGGKHRNSSMFGVKDWALAAMELYQDIMQIFINLLALFGETQK